MDSAPILHAGCSIALVILVIGMALAVARLLLGPTLPDRVVALDALATMAVGALALVAISSGQSVLLDVALAMALITFLGTVALAISLEKGVFK
ncbi:MAG: monovalent cation/H+ antiporter complex subunit F [Terrimicrobiaceae bacterium]|nr:monovalent cation/H+ antiporter complex subunit F [Terrimicrobiaceae bacterium]